MKILYITSDYFYNIGGINQHIENLTEFVGKNHNISIIYLNQKDDENLIIDEKKRQIYLIPHKGSKFNRFINYPLKKIQEIIKDENPDLIHVHTLFDAFKIKKTFTIPMIFTNHSSSYLKMYNNYFLRKFVLEKVLRKFDLIISPSTELFEKTFHKNKLMVSNGVDVNRFNLINREKINKEMIFEKFNINPIYKDYKVMVSTRRLVDKNGVLDFVRANIKYLQENKVIYLIIGDGEQFSDVNKLKKEHKLDNLILFGSLPNKEIENFYYIADFCIIPSKMEAISISALEAMASGSVVIANKVGGLAELISDKVTGLFLKNLSLDLTLTKDLSDSKVNEIRENAFNYVNKNYSWDFVAQETIKIYQKLLIK